MTRDRSRAAASSRQEEMSNDRSNLTLSDRQLECLRLVALGLSSPEIGRTLGISPRTVDEYVSDACLKLGARTRVQAIAIAIRTGLI